MMASPVSSCFFPPWLKWVSLIPKMCSRKRRISSPICPCLPASSMVLTFHEPMRRDLFKDGGVSSATSSRLWPLVLIVPTVEGAPSSPHSTMFSHFCLKVSSFLP